MPDFEKPHIIVTPKKERRLSWTLNSDYVIVYHRRFGLLSAVRVADRGKIGNFRLSQCEKVAILQARKRQSFILSQMRSGKSLAESIVAMRRSIVTGRSTRLSDLNSILSNET